MAISANYPVPVYVNGYACNNCTQVAEAKKGIDPADPKAGPYGVDASAGSSQAGNSSGVQSPAVIFGGALAGASTASSPNPQPRQAPSASGGLLNISV